MTKTKKGIALSVCLILGAIIFTNTSLEAKNSNDKPEYAQDEIIVKFKKDNKKPFRIIKIPKGKVEETVQAYKSKTNVVYAEPNYILYAFDAPTDTHYADWQWALNDTGQTLDGRITNATTSNDINWEDAWANFNGASFSPTTIAILDSGINASHPDLTNKLVKGKNFTNGKPNDTKDIYGHGTHVTGIAGAETNNNLGIAGVAFADNIKIMPVKVLGNNGCSTAGSVANGIYYAADNGAKVINLSLGGKYFSDALKDAVDYAWENGVLIAASAGNDGDSTLRYPASYDKVMSVAATDYNDERASFSNYNSEIDISAPGVKVLSTIIYKEGVREYGLGSGTSMSCPHVAGLAGLLFAQDSSRTNAEVRAIIEESADDLGVTGRDNYFGHGKIDVHAALACASPVDKDGDGYYSDVDCNDNDASINPGATENCSDGFDNNCDGLVDCKDPDCIDDPNCATVNPCKACSGEKCNGVCTKKEDPTCPDCQQQ